MKIRREMTICELHPAVPLLWFAAAGALAMLYWHPIMLLQTLIAAIFLHKRLKNSKLLRILFPIMGMTALVNPLFSHEGATILAYFPNGNPLTMESIFYGIAAALMLGAAAALCFSFGEVITTDKLLWLIGRILPSLAMLISMTLRFVPRFVGHLREAYRARVALLGPPQKKVDKIRMAAAVTSMTVTWAMENSVDTADSMKCRGWGLSGRTSYSNFRMTGRDWQALAVIGALTLYILAGIGTGALEYQYYPIFEAAQVTPFGISFLLAHAILVWYPLLMEVNYGNLTNK